MNSGAGSIECGLMIVFDLLCGAGHRFEGWFGSAEDFGAQKERGMLCCPTCGSGWIERIPSATRFNVGAENPAEAVPARTETTDALSAAHTAYSKLIDVVLKSTEDVGREFPAEARRIFYREAPTRAIRGQASQEEHDALVDEGVPVQRLPIPSPDRWN